MDMKELRERAGLKGVDVASKLDCAESTVRNWDIGKTSPHLAIEQVPILLDLYGVSLPELIEAVAESRKKYEEGLVPSGTRGRKPKKK